MQWSRQQYSQLEALLHEKNGNTATAATVTTNLTLPNTKV
jgi:hypothetical protein